MSLGLTVFNAAHGPVFNAAHGLVFNAAHI